MPRPKGSKNRVYDVVVVEPTPTTGLLVLDVTQRKSVRSRGKPVEDLSTIPSENIIEGWVTINKSEASKYIKSWYYTGGDIHDTEEKARKVTAPNRVAIAKISFSIK